jgi:uncharacterized membrane protein
MTRIRVLNAAVLPAFVLACGCSAMSPTDNGVVAGGAAGAVAGGIVGHALHNTGAGAAVGLVGGAITGGLVGNQVEKKQARDAAAADAAAAQAAIAEVIQMAQNHVADDVIITKVRTSPVVYHLTSQDVVTLKQNGVSDPVVNEMMSTATRYPRRVYSAAPVYGPPPGTVVVVEEPPPPPPVAVGVGFRVR